MEEAAQPSQGERLGRDLFMVALALFSIGMLIYDEVKHPTGETRQALIFIDLVIVVIFAVEFGVRLWRAESKAQFLRRNWYEIPGLVPMVVGEASFLRLFRLARIARIFRLFRVVAIFARLKRANRIAERFLIRSHVLTVLAVFVTVLLVCAYAVYYFEQPTNPQDWDYFDALWFSLVTATTVGYGEYYPVTPGGRAVTSILLLMGVGLVGTLAATFANALAAQRQDAAEGVDPEPKLLEDRLRALSDLHERGRLTDDEYAAAKKRILSEAS